MIEHKGDERQKLATPTAPLRGKISFMDHSSDDEINIDDLITLVEAGQNSAQDERIRAISKLGDVATKSADVRAIVTLIDCVRGDMDARVVNHTISVLSRIKAYSATPVIIDALLATHIAIYDQQTDPDFIEDSPDSLRIRCTAAQALGRMGDDQAIVSLMSILNDKNQNYRLRLACAESLGKLGNQNAVDPLINILSDDREKSVYLKESAAKALGMLGDIRAIEPLIDILESKKGIRDKFNFLKEQVIEAIARIGQPDMKAQDTLLYALQDEAPSIRLAAVEALEDIGDESCIQHILPLVSDSHDDIAIAAISAIYNLGGEGEVKELLKRDNLPQFLRDEIEEYLE